MRKQHWYVEGVVKYHRQISTKVNGLITSGFHIDYIDEPIAIDEALVARPGLISESRRPPFLLIKSKE